MANVEKSCFMRRWGQIESQCISQHANPEHHELLLNHGSVPMPMNKGASRAEFSGKVRIAYAISRNANDVGRRYLQLAMLARHAKVWITHFSSCDDINY
jgi:hypothetical protein